MSYYDDVLKKIDTLIDNKEYDKALSTLKDELSVAYIPRDFEKLFEERLDRLSSFVKNDAKTINDEELFSYLKSTPEKQLVAVNILDTKNLRDYLDVVEDYLLGDGLKNAKVLLIDSLIRQEISESIKAKIDDIDYEFIPKYLLPPEESDGYKSAKKLIDDYFMKEPSKLRIANDLLYKDVILMLPLNPEEQEGELLFKKVIDFIEKAFNNNLN